MPNSTGLWQNFSASSTSTEHQIGRHKVLRFNKENQQASIDHPTKQILPALSSLWCAGRASLCAAPGVSVALGANQPPTSTAPPACHLIKRDQRSPATHKKAQGLSWEKKSELGSSSTLSLFRQTLPLKNRQRFTKFTKVELVKKLKNNSPGTVPSHQFRARCNDF